jgi:hypothetical protein
MTQSTQAIGCRKIASRISIRSFMSPITDPAAARYKRFVQDRWVPAV